MRLKSAGEAAEEGPCDHAADADAALVEQFARGFAQSPQAVQTEGLLMGGDLHDAVGAGVEDGLAGAQVLHAECCEDVGAGCGVISEKLRPRRGAAVRRRGRRETLSKVAKGSSSGQPINSQWPVVVSLPAERAVRRAHSRFV